MKEKKTTKSSLIPRIELSQRNFQIFGIGILILILGFFLMSFGPWDNPLSRSVSPLVLLSAYLVVFPVAILYGKAEQRPTVEDKRRSNDRRDAKRVDRRIELDSNRRKPVKFDRRKFKRDRREL